VKKSTSSRSGVRDEQVYVEEGEEKGDEEDSDGDFFNAGEGAAMTSRYLLALHPKADKVSDTEEGPVGPHDTGPQYYDASRAACPVTETSTRKT
jgi:hypothetical protein